MTEPCPCGDVPCYQDHQAQLEEELPEVKCPKCDTTLMADDQTEAARIEGLEREARAYWRELGDVKWQRDVLQKKLEERETHWKGRLESSWRREDISADLRIDLFRAIGSLRSALAELVALKDGPRDEDYERRKPLAWQAARDLLTGLDLQPPAKQEWDCGSGQCDPNTGCPACSDEDRSWVKRA